MDLKTKRRKEGLCAWCGEPPEPGRKACSKCHHAHIHDKRRILGLCARCGEPADPGYKSCTKHREYHRLKSDEAHLRAKSKGLCAHCTKRPPAEGMTVCRFCADRSLARITRRKAAGLCATCGKRPPAASKTRCEPCCAKTRKRENNYRCGGHMDEVLARDENRCRLCHRAVKLVIHHIDGTGEGARKGKANNEMSNLISLCGRCHITLETFVRCCVDHPLLMRLVKGFPLPDEPS